MDPSDHRTLYGRGKAILVDTSEGSGLREGADTCPAGATRREVRLLLRRATLFALAGALALAWAATAAARNGRYVFDGGTARQRAQVRIALEVSSFDWSIVPAVVTIHLRKGTSTHAARGEIWIDTNLLDSGSFAWGLIQHEYAHQVDFFLLNDDQRAKLNAALGARIWSRNRGTASLHGPHHSSLGAERFASTLAWAYWQSPANSLKPTSKKDESAAMPPAKFRALLEPMLGIGTPVPVVTAR
jgi:hypothetical protein